MSLLSVLLSTLLLAPARAAATAQAGDGAAEGLPPPGCTPSERDAVEWARRLAAGRVQDAWFAVWGPTSEPRPNDRTRAAAAYAKLFFGDDVFKPDEKGNVYDLEGIVRAMRDRLTSGFQYECLPSEEAVKKWKARSSDEEKRKAEILEKVKQCHFREGYVVGSVYPVYLCEPFFRAGREEQVRTLVHESAHLAGVKQVENESYCGGTGRLTRSGMTTSGGFDCRTPCGARDINVADNWAHFLHCVWLTGEGAKGAGAKPDGAP